MTVPSLDEAVETRRLIGAYGGAVPIDPEWNVHGSDFARHANEPQFGAIVYAVVDNYPLVGVIEE